MSFRVNLALGYTELTEELGRLRELSSLQGRILRTLLQEQARSGGERTRGQRAAVATLHFLPRCPGLFHSGGEWVGTGGWQGPGSPVLTSSILTPVT